MIYQETMDLYDTKTLLRENTLTVPAAAATKSRAGCLFQIDLKWLNFASKFYDSYKPSH